MVFKTEKHGVRTGNTFKRWNTRYYRKYKSQAYLIRSHIPYVGEDGMNYQDYLDFNDTGGFGEDKSMKDGIEYSLNKQMRWEIPKLLENKILNENHEEDFAIELIERHRVRKMANCVNVCSTTGIYRNGKLGENKQFVVKGRNQMPGHFQSNSVLKNTNPKKRRNRRRRDNQNEDIGNINGIDDQGDNNDDRDEHVTKNESKIRYEVHYPAPTDSYLCHIPERIGIYTGKDYTWNGCRDKTQRCKKLANMNTHIKESLDMMDDSLYESEEENTFVDLDDVCHDVTTQEYHVTLDAILRHANTASRLVSERNIYHCNSSTSLNASSSTKDHVVYIDKGDAQYYDLRESDEVQQTPTDHQIKSPVKMEPVHVIFDNEVVSTQFLINKYGKNYLECECFPRKFIITISNRVNQLDNLKASNATSNVCIVFVHDVDNEINTSKENVYKVMLNGVINETISSMTIETIFDYMESTVEEVIDRTMFFIDTLPENSIVCEIESISYRNKVSKTSLEQCAEWSTDAYLPRNNYLLDYFISSTKPIEESECVGDDLVNQLEATQDDVSMTKETNAQRYKMVNQIETDLDDSTIVSHRNNIDEAGAIGNLMVKRLDTSEEGLAENNVSSRKNVEEVDNLGFEMVNEPDKTLVDSSENVASAKEQFCCICYSVIDATTSGTSLITCSHWFCDSCWMEYLHTKITDGSLSLICPEYDCNQIIDSGTVLSFVNLRDILKYAKLCHDNEVQKHTLTKWCPNEKCGRVLKINNINTKNCQCLCGLKICFDCMDPPHWPASCEAVKQYYKRMRESGDISLVPPELRKHVTVRGKNCPGCHRFVEKNGGCPFMNCVCSASFCWGCGELWNSREHGPVCYKHGYKDTHGTTAREFKQRDVYKLKTRNKFYKMALIHRVNQHPDRIRKIKKSIKPLSKKLQGHVFKTEKSGKVIDYQFGDSYKTLDSEYRKALHLVTNTFDLYVEMNHVAEHTAVLLSSEKLPNCYSKLLRPLSNRLSSIAGSIYDLYCHHESVPTGDVFNKLIEARLHAEKTMQCLVRCIKSIKS